MGISDFFINRLVKTSKGFSRGKKIKSGNGSTVMSSSLASISVLLIVHARKHGDICEERLKILERVYGHFYEHVMLREASTKETIDNFRYMDQEYDSKGSYQFRKEFNDFFRDLNLREQLPM